jgi:HPt (histidine-containing phosphotransfer) domain-containing protein
VRHEALDLQRAIDALWGDARPRMIARVEALEAVAARPLAAPERVRVYHEAHSLTGTLGAFGRLEASAAAREAERAAEAGDHTALAAAVRALRQTL